MHEFASDTARNGLLALSAIQQSYEAIGQAFASDAQPLGEILSSSPEVILMGPFGGRQIGHGEVARTFQRDASRNLRWQWVPGDLRMRMGEELAYCVCIERCEIARKGGKAKPAQLRATSILRGEGDDYRLVYRHTDPLPAAGATAVPTADQFAALEGESPDADIVKALERFKAAVLSMFSGNIKPVADVWMQTDDVSLAGPAGGIQIGWDSVRAQFEQSARADIRGRLEYAHPVIRVCHDMAYASYLESSPDMTINGKPYPLSLRTTTVFREHDHRWRIVHHHSDAAPCMAALLSAK